METCAAELVIYIPKQGAPQIADAIIKALPGELTAREGPIAFTCVFGGTIVLRDSNAPYGNPYGIRPDELPRDLDWDLHVAAHYEWEATIVWFRAGVRAERASASETPEPLLSVGDFDRLMATTAGDRSALEVRLLSFLTKPAPSYEAGTRRVLVDWDGNVVQE